MSNYYKRGKTYTIRVPTRSGYIARTTGTGHRPTVRAMQRMFEDLRDRRQWDVLDPVAEKAMTVGELFDYYSGNRLDDLRAELDDVDLNEYVDGWQAALRNKLGNSESIPHYLSHVRTLIEDGKPFYRSALTYERLVTWLDERPVGASTKRKYKASMASFCKYLVSAKVLATSPIRDVTAPKPTGPRRRYLDMTEMKRLLDALPEPYRTLSALMHGTGIEISVALGLKRRDIDVRSRVCEARGTKNLWRNRRAFIADWAWPFVERHIELMTPEAPLFPGIDRWSASDAHRSACEKVGIVDYQMRDARHTYAVRAIRAGAAFEVVRKQLGHKDTSMVVRVYGRFEPREDEMRSWEARAAELDRQIAND